MQTRRGFVEDVQRFAPLHALQFGGELDALSLAAGKLRGRLSQPDISQADLPENAQRPATLAAYAALTGSGRHRQAAEEGLATVATLAERAPRFAGWSLAAAEAMLDGPLEIAVVGRRGPERDALEAVARRRPGAVVVVSDGPRDDIPLLTGRTEVDGRPAAYVCRHQVCERPVTDPADLG